LCVLLCVALSACSKQEGKGAMGSEFDIETAPAVDVPGWRLEETSLIDNSGDLFMYMDGAGEIYLAYGFKKLAVAEYSGPCRIIVEVYDQGTSEDAFGVYSFDPSKDDAGVGTESSYGKGSLRFWKDKYFGRIVAEMDYENAQEDILNAGGQIAAKIRSEGPKPDMLKLVPAEFELAEGPTFFHAHAILNATFYLADDNILELGPETNALTGRVAFDGGKVRVLLVEYPTVEAVSGAASSFSKSYLEGERELKPGEVTALELENGEWNAFLLKGNRFAAVFEGRTENITTLLDQLATHLND